MDSEVNAKTDGDATVNVDDVTTARDLEDALEILACSTVPETDDTQIGDSGDALEEEVLMEKENEDA